MMLIQLHVWQDSERGMRHLLGKTFSISSCPFHAFNGQRASPIKNFTTHHLCHANISSQTCPFIFDQAVSATWNIVKQIETPTVPTPLQPLSALQLCLHEHRMLLRDLWDRLKVGNVAASLSQSLMVQWKITLILDAFCKGRNDLLKRPLSTSMRQWVSFGLDHPSPNFSILRPRSKVPPVASST